MYDASSSGHLNVVKYLVEQGADINKSSKRGTPLYAAVRQGYLDVVKYLVAKGVDISVVYEEDIYYAIRGASKNKHIHTKETPLEAASRMGHTNIVKYLQVISNIKSKSVNGRAEN